MFWASLKFHESVICPKFKGRGGCVWEWYMKLSKVILRNELVTPHSIDVDC